MSFDQIFIVAVVVTAAVSLFTTLMAAQEVRSRRVQRHGPVMFTPASGLMHEDDARGVGQNAALLHSIAHLR